MATGRLKPVKRKRFSDDNDDEASSEAMEGLGMADDDPIVKRAPQKRQKGRLHKKECIICFSNVAVNRFPKLPHKDADEHDRSVCFSCWEQHLASEVEAKGWDMIACPQCDKTLEEAEVKKLAKGETYGV